MPLGLTSASSIFQYLMNEVFQEYLNKFVVCYLDEILIYSKNFDEYEEHVRLILQKL